MSSDLRGSCLAGAEIGYRLLRIEIRICTERLRGGFYGPLLKRRVRAQRVLYAVSELSEYGIRYIRRLLCDEINAHAF